VGQQVVERRVLVEPLRRGLGAHLGHAGNVVRRIADEREVIDDLLRIDVELDLDACRSSAVSVIVLTSVTRSSTSCAMSLSPVEITTLRPAAAAWRASVPITSSASTPATRSSGSPSASTAASSGSTWARRSSASVAVALVLGEQLVAKRLAGSVEHDAKQWRVLLLQQLEQHVDHAEHRTGRLPFEFVRGGNA